MFQWNWFFEFTPRCSLVTHCLAHANLLKRTSGLLLIKSKPHERQAAVARGFEFLLLTLISRYANTPSLTVQHLDEVSARDSRPRISENSNNSLWKGQYNRGRALARHFITRIRAGARGRRPMTVGGGEGRQILGEREIRRAGHPEGPFALVWTTVIRSPGNPEWQAVPINEDRAMNFTESTSRTLENYERMSAFVAPHSLCALALASWKRPACCRVGRYIHIYTSCRGRDTRAKTGAN